MLVKKVIHDPYVATNAGEDGTPNYLDYKARNAHLEGTLFEPGVNFIRRTPKLHKDVYVQLRIPKKQEVEGATEVHFSLKLGPHPQEPETRFSTVSCLMRAPADTLARCQAGQRPRLKNRFPHHQSLHFFMHHTSLNRLHDSYIQPGRGPQCDGVNAQVGTFRKLKPHLKKKGVSQNLDEVLA
jgi:hypothetical protein